MVASRHRRTLFAALVVLVLVACSGGDSASPVASAAITQPAPSPSAGGTSTSTIAASTGWTIDTSPCADGARAEQPMAAAIKIGSVMPLSGGAAPLFGPVKDGFQLYLDYANSHGLVTGHTLSTEIVDDQYDAAKTAAVTNQLVNGGVDLIAGIIGTPDNLAVRDSLNKSCIPQLLAQTGSTAWGQVGDYPWTTGAVVPYDVEAAVYAAKLSELKPNAKVALYSVNNDFGKAYVDAFKQLVAQYKFEIVDEQTVEPGDLESPVAQLGDIAGKSPDAIIAVPLSVQCPLFLGELANVTAKTPGWAPATFLTNTCASKLFLGLAGPAAEGVYSSQFLLDANDPKNASNPGVKAFLDAFVAAGLVDDPGATQAGWNVGEATVAILNAALDTGALSRKSVIEAARNLTYTPTMARPGVQYKMNGSGDAIAFQTLQVVQWSTASQTFTDVGEPIGFES
jgi:branched-chain amino acid transport system substrate-binding protein